MDNLIDKVAAIAKDVYRVLGAGHVETPYQKAMEVGLRLQGIKFEAEKVIEIKYEGHYVGDCNVDILVEDSIAVELKALKTELGAPEEQQLIRYMAILGVSHGVLVNFPQAPRRKKGGGVSDLPEIIVLPRHRGTSAGERT